MQIDVDVSGREVVVGPHLHLRVQHGTSPVAGDRGALGVAVPAAPLPAARGTAAPATVRQR